MKNLSHPKPQRITFALRLVALVALTAPTLRAEPQGFLSRLGRSVFHTTERLERGTNDENTSRVTTKNTSSRTTMDKAGLPTVSFQNQPKQTTKVPLPPLHPTAPTRYQAEEQPYIQLQPGGYFRSPKPELQPAQITVPIPAVAKTKLPANERLTYDPITANPPSDVAPSNSLKDPKPTTQSAPVSMQRSDLSGRRATSPNSSPQATATVPPVVVPFATYLSYGRVRMPFAPYHTLNVEGMPSGSLARDPTSGLKFRVP